MKKKQQKVIDIGEENASLIEELLASDYASPPPGSLVSEAVWKEQQRHELQDQLSAKPFRNRFSRGMHLAMAQLKKQLSQVEFKAIQEDLARGVEHLVDLFSAETDATEGPRQNRESFQDILQLSSGTIEQIYQCGAHFAKEKAFQEASDIFFVLSVLDHKRHNVWMALGLSEQHLGHLDPALEAYAMAIMTDLQDPMPYLHSAECYQASGQKADAEECLVACMAHVQHVPAKQERQIRELADQCRMRLSA